MTKTESNILNELIDEMRAIKTVLIGDPDMGTQDQGLIARQRADEDFRKEISDSLTEIKETVQRHDERFEEVKDLVFFVRIIGWIRSKAAIFIGALVGLLADPWTSRARPTFMYVIYLMILSAIPMGVVAAFDPTMATAIATGMQAWLAAIPDGLWATFGIGYSGYSVARSIDKKNALKK